MVQEQALIVEYEAEFKTIDPDLAGKAHDLATAVNAFVLYFEVLTENPKS